MGRIPGERAGLLKVLVAATIWGSIPLLVRATDAHPAVIVFYRVLFAGVALVGWGALSGRLRGLKDLSLRTIAALVGMGMLLTVNWILFFWAITLVDVAVAVLLAYCGPVFVAVLGPLSAGGRFDSRIAIPLVLALGGTAVIVGPDTVSFAGSSGLGAALAFASAFTYAVLVVNAKRLIQGIDPVVYMSVEYSTATLLLLPAFFLLPGPSGLAGLGALATLGVVHTAITGFLFLSALKAARADRVAIMTYAEPLSAVLFAAFFLGERLTLSTVLGGIAVIAGGALVAGSRTVAPIEEPLLVADGEAAFPDPASGSGEGT